MVKCIDSAKLQVQAIDRMIDSDVACEDVLTQISAAKGALNKVAQIVLEGHVNHCIKESFARGDADDAVASFIGAVERFANMQ